MAHPAKPYATVPTLFQRVQDELSAIEEITRVLGALPDHDTRVRVITWIEERFAHGFQGAPLPPPAQPAVARAAPPVRSGSDSGLSFPDDLFEPAIKFPEPADLHGVFDSPPPATPQALDLNGIFDPPDEEVVEPARDTPKQPVALERLDDVFELVPPGDAPACAELAETAPDGPTRSTDRRQLSLLLLADMWAAPALEMHEATNLADAIRESPVPAASAAPPPVLRLATAHQPPPSAPPAPPTPASAPAPTIAAEPQRPAPQHAAQQQPDPQQSQESMEAMLRSLVDDFRQLADEWGNT